jgi:trigger factor
VRAPQRAGTEPLASSTLGGMQTTVEETARHTVRLTVEVPADEFEAELDRAYRRVASEVKIPGFRKGKAPRQIIDVQVGKAAVYEELIREAVPAYYVQAVREHQLAPIADPEIDLDQVEEGKPLVFTATVEVRPRLTLAEDDYKSVTVHRPPAEVSEAEVSEQLDRLRERFAELSVVGHPARRGDYVLTDIRGTIHDEEVPEATGRDVLYEVGSGGLVPELDAELEGKRAGDIVKFNASLPERFGERSGQEITFQALVKEVKEKVLPPADDAFAKTASEFDTLEELRGDIRAKLHMVKEAAADAAVRDRVLLELVSRLDTDLPDTLVDQETERRVQNASERAERQGLTLEQVLEAGGVDELQFRSDARGHAIRAVKADLILEAVARQEGIQVAKEDLEREIRALAESMGRDPKEVTRLLEKSGQITHLAGDIIRSKALDLLVENANVVSEGSSPASPEEPDAEPPTKGPGELDE